MKFSMTLEGVEQEFRKLFKTQSEILEAESKVSVAKMLGDLVSATPVDTGKARASWNVKKQGLVFNVNNDAEYIQYLNQGSSKQAPAYFIERIALNYGEPLGTVVEVKD